MEVVDLPVGFEAFHDKNFVNYQLNRAHSLGYARRDELTTAAKEIVRPADCLRVFDALSVRSERDGRLANAASYQRIAEFFTPGESPDKLSRYMRYRDLFDSAFAIARHDVPYEGSVIPAYVVPALGDVRGTVLVHGGFDSLIEEFLAIWQRLSAAGLEVVAFDGPGQGGARRLGGLVFDHDWEKPVGALLDHFGLERAGLVGISMGGYWALRAAAHEPRIARVVSWPPVYDWMLRAPRPVRGIARAMVKRRGFMRWSVRTRARLVPTLGQVVDQALYNVDSTDPYDVVEFFMAMNPVHLGSDHVRQEVLILVGEHDRFQPPPLAVAQTAALVNAASVTVRTFTEDEHADQHCQMGNLDLACGTAASWLARPAAQAMR